MGDRLIFVSSVTSDGSYDGLPMDIGTGYFDVDRSFMGFRVWG